MSPLNIVQFLNTHSPHKKHHRTINYLNIANRIRALCGIPTTYDLIFTFYCPRIGTYGGWCDCAALYQGRAHERECLWLTGDLRARSHTSRPGALQEYVICTDTQFARSILSPLRLWVCLVRILYGVYINIMRFCMTGIYMESFEIIKCQTNARTRVLPKTLLNEQTRCARCPNCELYMCSAPQRPSRPNPPTCHPLSTRR